MLVNPLSVLTIGLSFFVFWFSHCLVYRVFVQVKKASGLQGCNLICTLLLLFLLWILSLVLFSIEDPYTLAIVLFTKVRTKESLYNISIDLLLLLDSWILFSFLFDFHIILVHPPYRHIFHALFFVRLAWKSLLLNFLEHGFLLFIVKKKKEEEKKRRNFGRLNDRVESQHTNGHLMVEKGNSKCNTCESWDFCLSS